MTTLLHPINWDLVFLRETPFPEIPPRDPESAVWAGMKKLKRQLDELLNEAKTNPSSQVVLNWGAWGSGKTHSARYFGIPERLPKVKGRQIKKPWILYIHTARDPVQPDTVFYRDILESLQFEQLRHVVKDLIYAQGEDIILRTLQKLVGSEPLGKAIWLMGLEKGPSGQMYLFGDEYVSDDWDRTLETYFYSQQTKTDLKKLGLSRGIDNSQDRFRVLGAILQCLIGFAPVEEIEEHCRVVLWIDEMEDLIYLASKQYRPFTQGLRDLIDRIPNYLTLLMNFTLAAPEAYEDATAILGQAVMDRVTHQIYYKEPDKEEAYYYVLDLLKSYRTEKFDGIGLDDTFPFTPECLKWIIETLSPGQSTPRSINKRCGDIITKALTGGRISTRGTAAIDIDFVKKLDEERIDQELT